ncbi:MAG: cytidine deaminase [Brevinema sp.]
MDKTQVIINLIAEASAYRERAYVPYSHFPVCAVLIDLEGRRFFGVNIENASYGLTICAERNALCAAITAGVKKIATLVVVTDTLSPSTPCGACRQMLSEFSTSYTEVICANFHGNYTLYTMDQLLPFTFSARDLNEHAEK